MVAGRDDEAVAFVGLWPDTAVQGRTPAHAQGTHARAERARVAVSWPDAHERWGPSLLTKVDTISPQTIPETTPIDHIDLEQVAGQESQGRPAQTPLAGWDGENDAFAPDWTRPIGW